MGLLFTYLQAFDRDVTPEQCKVHLATRDGVDPLELGKGEFEDWQSYQQSPKSFSNCTFVVALIRLEKRPHHWLFTGVYEVCGEPEPAGQSPRHYRQQCKRWGTKEPQYICRMCRRCGFDEIEDRLIIRYERSGRQPYRRGQGLARELEVHEEKQTPEIRKRLAVLASHGTRSTRYS